MVDIVKQLCIKSYEIVARNGDYFKAQQGQEYTTTLPAEDEDDVIVLSNYWVRAPKENFIESENNPYGDFK